MDLTALRLARPIALQTALPGRVPDLHNPFRGGGAKHRRHMTFKDAVASALVQYASLQGRSSRSEFWFFALFILIVSAAVYLVSLALPERYGPIMQSLVFMALAIPLFSVFVRRMHDIGASAWRALVFCVPVLHIICLYWALKRGQEGENEYGPAPLD